MEIKFHDFSRSQETWLWVIIKLSGYATKLNTETEPPAQWLNHLYSLLLS